MKFSALVISVAILAAFAWPAEALTRAETARYRKASADGLAYFRQKNYPKAIENFKEAATLSPLDLSVRYYLGLSAFSAGNYALAKEELAKAIVISSPQSTYHKNAVKCFSDYKKEFSHVLPYSCAVVDGKYFSWSKDRTPLKIYISHGLKLPAGYRGEELNADKLHNLSGWLGSKSYVSKIKRDRHYDDSFYEAARKGIAEWSFARSEKIVDFDLVKDPDKADVLVFWCSKLPGDRSATTILPQKKGDRAIIQIAVEYVLASQAHLRADTVRYIAAHEFGSALGLKESGFERDIMYPIEKTARHKTGFNPGGSNRVSHNDSTTLSALYSLPAQSPE